MAGGTCAGARERPARRGVHQKKRSGDDRQQCRDRQKEAPDGEGKHSNALTHLRASARKPCFPVKPCQRGVRMAEFRRLSPDFAVAPQLTLDDVARAAAEGFKTIIKNRPENEEPGQPNEADIIAAAQSAGMTFPRAALPPARRRRRSWPRRCWRWSRARGPILAYCRSGTRSAAAWAHGAGAFGARRAGRDHRSGAPRRVTI